MRLDPARSARPARQPRNRLHHLDRSLRHGIWQSGYGGAEAPSRDVTTSPPILLPMGLV